VGVVAGSTPGAEAARGEGVGGGFVDACHSRGGDVAGCLGGKVGGFVDEAADLEGVKEGSRVDGCWSEGVVVDAGDHFEDAEGHLGPRPVKGCWVLPVSSPLRHDY
jgi:hypothetical protein